jgi:hypothetical protein
MNIEDCIDYCSGFQNVDEARSDLARIEEQRKQLLWFVANLMNEKSAMKEGYSMPVRWQCLRADLQHKYIEEAMQTVTAWWLDEEAARVARETHTPYVAPNQRVQPDPLPGATDDQNSDSAGG